MAEVSAAEQAYEAALREIERARKAGGEALDLSGSAFADLDRIPSEVATIERFSFLNLDGTKVSDLSPLRDMTALQTLSLEQTAVSDLSPLRDMTTLQSLWLSQTAVSDLSPLRGMTKLQVLTLDQTAVSDLSPLRDMTVMLRLSLEQTAVSDLSPLRDMTTLQSLWLNQTAVSDLSPLQGMTSMRLLQLSYTGVSDLNPLRGMTDLRTLWLSGSKVADLRPIAHLRLLGSEAYTELAFYSTPAAASSPQLLTLANSGYHRKRTRETLAYLKTLPPWPEPLPWEQPEEPPLTVAALIEAQDRAGWRYVPGVNALQLYVTDLPSDARQEQMARMVAERSGRLIDKLGTRVNSGGLRQETHEEVKRLQAILADDSRSLGMRSLELWGSLIALGDLLEENDRAARAGRDTLDLLPAEARAALSTLLGVAAGLVRSFPEARALDDDHGSFLRRSLSREVVRELLEGALRAALIEPRSAALVQHVAVVADKEGQQAQKADGVTMAGLRNLVLAATLLSATVGGAVGGVASGITSDIGTDISNHYQLGEKAVEFLTDSEAEINAFLESLTPDERAALKAALEDAKGPR